MMSAYNSSLQNPLIQKIISDQETVVALKSKMNERIHRILRRTELHKNVYAMELREVSSQATALLYQQLITSLVEYQRELLEMESKVQPISNLDGIASHVEQLEQIIEKYEKIIAQLIADKIKQDDKEMMSITKRLLEDVETNRLLMGKPNPEERPSFSAIPWGSVLKRM